MGRVLAVLLVLGLSIYAFLDCVQTAPRRVRRLPKAAWLIVIVLLPVLGPAAWLLGGRPDESRPGVVRRGSSTRRPVAPDDDPDFLREIGRRSQPRLPEPRERPPDEDNPEHPDRR